MGGRRSGRLLFRRREGAKQGALTSSRTPPAPVTEHRGTPLSNGNLDQLRPRSFVTRYLMLFGGETFSKLCVMAAFVYLARVLTPHDYGIIELALSVTVFFVLGVESGMGLYGARVVAARPERTAASGNEARIVEHGQVG